MASPFASSYLRIGSFDPDNFSSYQTPTTQIKQKSLFMKEVNNNQRRKSQFQDAKRKNYTKSESVLRPQESRFQQTEISEDQSLIEKIAEQSSGQPENAIAEQKTIEEDIEMAS